MLNETKQTIDKGVLVDSSLLQQRGGTDL